MTKNIALFLDGTWNDDDDPDSRTNVLLLHDECVNDGTQQLTAYFKGVGTEGWYDKKLGGLHGVGLSNNIREAYTFLVHHFEPGDRVFLFGFSRGAFTARSLGGLLSRCGLLQRSEAGQVTTLYEAYRDRDAARMQAYKTANLRCPVAMLGVWDTVGALGIPVSFLQNVSAKVFQFHDTTLSDEVEFACHAVAIDERRKAFEPTLWEESAATRGRLQQVWFAGVHSDVGGGYPERHHADVTLNWMRAHAQARGLQIKPGVQLPNQADVAARIHASTYTLFGIEIGAQDRDAPAAGAVTPRVHWSVVDKLRLQTDYQPAALQRHLTERANLAPYEVDISDRPDAAG